VGTGATAVMVYVGGTGYAATLSGTTWSLTTPTQAEGSYAIYAQATMGTSLSSPSNAITLTIDVTPPAPPTNVRTKAYHNKTIDLKWDPSTSSDVVGYLVYRKVGTTGSWALLTTTGVVPGTKYRDSSVSDGNDLLLSRDDGGRCEAQLISAGFPGRCFSEPSRWRDSSRCSWPSRRAASADRRLVRRRSARPLRQRRRRFPAADGRGAPRPKPAPDNVIGAKGTRHGSDDLHELPDGAGLSGSAESAQDIRSPYSSATRDVALKLPPRSWPVLRSR
jgi:hypothetical protein